mgnify:FL=1
MCYSVEASFGAFLFALILSYSLYKRNKGNDRSIAILMFGISIMQVAEFFMHLDPDCKSNMNKYSSMFGLAVLLMIQPLFSILSNINSQKKIFTKEIIFQLLLWIIYVLYITKYYWPKSSEWCSKKDCSGDCKLTWNWWKHGSDNIPQLLYLTLILLIPIYVMYKNNINKALVWLIYLFLSVVLIYNNKYFGTLWCFWGPLGVYLIQYYFI